MLKGKQSISCQGEHPRNNEHLQHWQTAVTSDKRNNEWLEITFNKWNIYCFAQGETALWFYKLYFFFFFVEVNDTNYDHWKWLLHNERGCGKTKDLDNGFLTCCHLGPNMQKMVKRSIWFAQRTITVDKGRRNQQIQKKKKILFWNRTERMLEKIKLIMII